jgi:hypothetical protein
MMKVLRMAATMAGATASKTALKIWLDGHLVRI